MGENRLVRNTPRTKKLTNRHFWKTAGVLVTGAYLLVFGCSERTENSDKKTSIGEPVKSNFDPAKTWVFLKNAKNIDPLTLVSEIEKFEGHPQQLAHIVISSDDERVWRRAITLIKDGKALEVAKGIIERTSGNFKKINAINKRLNELRRELEKQLKADRERI